MTRVFQAMAGAPQGGAEAFFERLVLALNRAGVEQRVAIRRDPGRAARLKSAGLVPAELPFGGWFDFVTRNALRFEIAAFKPQVVLTWMSRATAKCPKALPAMPFVHAARLGGYYDLKYYKRCDHLIANTRDIVRHIVEAGWPAERAHYLPNFVDAGRAAPVGEKPVNAPLLLALGRLHKNKGFDVLLRALKDVPRARLWIAGQGPEEQALKTLARELDVASRVEFLGWRDDTAALFAAADLFVCPSRHEPLGNVVIEAWAQEVPVVAAASQGPAELIQDGRNGLLVPLEDPAALGAAINRALGQPMLLNALKVSGKRAYEENFTEAKVVAQYLDFFARVAGQK